MAVRPRDSSHPAPPRPPAVVANLASDHAVVIRRAAALGPELVHGGDERDPDAGGGRNEIWHGAKSYPSAVAPRMSFPHPWAVFSGGGRQESLEGAQIAPGAGRAAGRRDQDTPP